MISIQEISMAGNVFTVSVRRQYHVRKDMVYRSIPGTEKKMLEVKIETTCKEQT